ncbi:hypothetical protein [Nocardia sp. NPDC055049]
MNDPIDTPNGLPGNPPAVHTPTTLAANHYLARHPAPAANSPARPHPVPPRSAPPIPNYHAAPQPVPHGYGMPPGYPMPIVSITQNNGIGAGPIVVRRGVNHGLHLVLTLVTCGLWLPIWIIVAILDAMKRP